MSLRSIQEDVDKWTSQFNPQYWPPLAMMARLTEETGEVAREINHQHGLKQKKLDESKNNLGQELSDLIFTICCIANNENINLSDEWKKLIKEKQYGRDNNRFERKN